MTREVNNLLVWIANNLQANPLSGLLPSGPNWCVDAYNLLDTIRDSFGLTEDEIGEVINPIREKIEKSQP